VAKESKVCFIASALSAKIIQIAHKYRYFNYFLNGESVHLTMIRIALLGLGGVGGYFGTKLSRTFVDSSEVEVVFLAREKTAAAIRENGIRLITPEEEVVAHPSVVATNASEAGKIDYLIVSVKSYDLESGLGQFRECISPQTIILPLLNGIDAEEKIRALFPKNEVWSGCVYIVSRITAPGVITETGNIHKLHFGYDPSAVGLSSSQQSSGRREELYRIFKSAHDDVFLHDNIRDVVWEKFIFISTIASLTSYLDVCIGKILEHEENRKLLEHLLNEICAVARAEKIVLHEDIVAITLGKMGKLPYETTSSMHSDFQKSGKTEFRSLTAHLVQLAQKHRLMVPAYQTVLFGLETRSKLTLPKP
jgi:2-dehydropantoate 2-reductase